MVPVLTNVQVERPTPRTAVAVFSGEHDMADKDKVSELLSSLVAENELVVVDFSQAEFIDSSILNVLVETKAGAEARGRTLRLQLGAADCVGGAFRASGLDELFDIEPTRKAALSRPSGLN